MAGPIGTLGTISTFTVAGYTFADVTSVIELSANMNNNNRSTLRAKGATSGYQVTSGKSFKLKAWYMHNNDATVKYINLFYADNDIGINSATALTNPVYPFGVASVAQLTLPATIAYTTTIPVIWSIPAGKYIGYDGSSPNLGQSTYCNVWGYEV